MVIARQFGKFLESQISKKKLKIIELTDKRGSCLLKNSIESFGRDILFVSTVKGIEGVVKEHMNDKSVLFTISDNYLQIRRNIKKMEDLTKLVEQFVNELVFEMKKAKLESSLIYRANDLPPFTFGKDQDLITEEFWRLLTTELRGANKTFYFVYEETEYKPDIISQFADVIIRMTSPPQIWTVL